MEYVKFSEAVADGDAAGTVLQDDGRAVEHTAKPEAFHVPGGVLSEQAAELHASTDDGEQRPGAGIRHKDKASRSTEYDADSAPDVDGRPALVHPGPAEQNKTGCSDTVPEDAAAHQRH